MITAVTMYRTDDDNVYESENAAAIHNAELKIYQWCENQGIGNGGEWNSDMIAELIIENSNELLSLLYDLSFLVAKSKGIPLD